MSSRESERGLRPRNPSGGGSEGAVEAPFDHQERESTAVIGPRARCRVDDGLAIVVDVP